MLLKEKVELVGCGRTDTGVNARDFIAHFDSECTDLIANKKHWLYKFNTVLPSTIAVNDIRRVKDFAHARFDARKRVYYYYLSQKRDPFRDAHTFYVYGELDFDLMNQAAAVLKEYEDFTSFSKSNTQVKTNVCKIEKALWLPCGNGEWRFEIRADRFLRGMVRAIVGTLIQVGKSKLTVSAFRKIIEAKDRQLAGANVPPNALFLCGVLYDKEVYID
jgi:tRNA pseudouridine38-40 synthase